MGVVTPIPSFCPESELIYSTDRSGSFLGATGFGNQPPCYFARKSSEFGLLNPIQS